uniref:Uncharacterized protein n=1 Tax=Arion vulgaris TaxID=1028688 RepID=A0A0B6ZQC4_9EUPU
MLRKGFKIKQSAYEDKTCITDGPMLSACVTDGSDLLTSQIIFKQSLQDNNFHYENVHDSFVLELC